MDLRYRMAGLAVLMVSVVLIIGFLAVKGGPMQHFDVFGVGISLTLVVLAFFGLITMYQSHKTGQPMDDEMTQDMKYRAGYYTWLITIYMALAVGYFIDDVPDMMPRHGATAVLLLSAATYSHRIVRLETESQNGVGGKSVKTRIKEYRARHDLTQEALAKKVGVRRETIVFLEKGRYNPSLRLAHDIAKALDSTIDDLFIFGD